MTDALTDTRSGGGPDPELQMRGPFSRPSVRVAPDNTVTSAPVQGAGSILSEAAQIVEGSRNQQHGDKERSFHAIAGMWTAYLAARRNPTGPIRPHDAAHMMSLMKKMRAEWGVPIRDHFVDDAGYSAIAGEISLAGVRGGRPEG